MSSISDEQKLINEKNRQKALNKLTSKWSNQSKVKCIKNLKGRIDGLN